MEEKEAIRYGSAARKTHRAGSDNHLGAFVRRPLHRLQHLVHHSRSSALVNPSDSINRSLRVAVAFGCRSTEWIHSDPALMQPEGKYCPGYGPSHDGNHIAGQRPSRVYRAGPAIVPAQDSEVSTRPNQE